MKGIKKLFVISAVSIGILLPGTVCNAAQAEAPAGKATAQDALQAAKGQVLRELSSEKQQSKWNQKSIHIEKPIEVYDPAGNLIAYNVNVIADKQHAGFIMVSAFLDEEPIMMWSDEGEAFEPEQVRGKLKSRSNQVIHEKVVWLGGVNFAGQFVMTDGSEAMVDKNGTNMQGKVPVVYPSPKTINEDARENWRKMKRIPLGDIGTNNDGVTNDDPNAWETDYLSIHRNYIWTDVNYKQFDYAFVSGTWIASGCSPTAGSNIMKYWSNQGMTNLNPTGIQRDIVLALRTEMGTTDNVEQGTGETWPWNIDDGLQAYARKHGRPNAVATNDNFSDYSTVVTEIDAQRPALQSYMGQTYYGDHTVTVVGYKEYVRDWYKPNSKYVVIRNNWSGEPYQNIWLRWGTWTSNVVTTFKP